MEIPLQSNGEIESAVDRIYKVQEEISVAFGEICKKYHISLKMPFILSKDEVDYINILEKNIARE